MPQHAKALRGVARHLAPDPDLNFANGKVTASSPACAGAPGELVVLADDDVRYEVATLLRTVRLLADADLVRPQNYFDELPWHARWDTARSLLNRVFTGDLAFPVGTFPAPSPSAAAPCWQPAATTATSSSRTWS